VGHVHSWCESTALHLRGRTAVSSDSAGSRPEPIRAERRGEKTSLKSPKVKVTDNIAGPRVTEEEQCSSRGETDNDSRDSDSDSGQTNEQ
jgi:hypothetical protein